MRLSWKTVIPALLAAALGPLALAVWNVNLGKRGFTSPVGGEKWFSPRPGFFDASGFRDPELSPVGSIFNWTDGDESVLRFPRIDRSQVAEVTIRVQGGTGATDGSSMTFSVDGVETARMPIPREPKRVALDLPAKPGRGATVALRVENAPGVMVENVRLGAVKGTLPLPPEGVGALAFASLAFFMALQGAEIGAAWALGLSAVGATGLGWLAARGGAFLGRYSETLGWTFLFLLISALLSRRIQNLAWRRAAIAAACVCAFRFALLSHPQLIDADASQHASHMSRLLAGEWIFTSATPPPAIRFPYPPLLSAAALPFSRLPAEDWVSVLRLIVMAAELLGSLVFARAVAAHWGESIGALTFALCLLSAEGTAILFVGNLSNLFGDALLFAACGWLLTGRDGAASVALLATFLSHFGDLLIGAPLGLMLAFFREPTPSQSWLRRLSPALAAIAASFVLYYRHFVPLYVEVFGRLTAVRAAGAEGPMNAPVSAKLARLAGDEWGITLLFAGLVLLGFAFWPEGRSLRRALGLWAIVAIVFIALGVLTPVQVRVGLAARPLVAALMAAALAGLWTRGRPARAATIAALAGIVVSSWIVAVSFFPAQRP